MRQRIGFEGQHIGAMILEPRKEASVTQQAIFDNFGIASADLAGW